MKGMIVDIFFNPAYRQCARGGPSTELLQALIVGTRDDSRNRGEFVPVPESMQIFSLTEEMFPVVVVRRCLAGEVYLHAEPYYCEEWPNERFKDTMCSAGGNYIYTSDSRYSETFGLSYPMSLHDRVETGDIPKRSKYTLQEALVEAAKASSQDGAKDLWFRPVAWSKTGRAMCLRVERGHSGEHLSIITVPSLRGGEHSSMPNPKDILGDWEVVSPDVVNQET